jgi:hypothetical protein
MDKRDDLVFTVALAGLAISLLLLAGVVRALQSDVELLRMTAVVPEVERDM